MTPYDIISKYIGLEYVIGVNDCNLMMFEATGLDVSNVKFNTIKEGREVLTNLCGFQTHNDYFNSINYKLISPYELDDGCILLSRIHCFVYYDGKVFGVSKNRVFEFMTSTFNELSKFKIYKKEQ
jgi:hypothetical protein